MGGRAPRDNTDAVHEDAIARAIPPAWRRLLRSGESARVHASLRGGDSAAEVELVAHLEFTEGNRLGIEVTLADAAQSSGAEEYPARLLSARERSVITLIAMGVETQEIAGELHVSASTVRTHVRNAMAKLGAHTRAQMVALAIAGNALDPGVPMRRAADQPPEA
jgi:DNA-binding NarL/FixJ family response regulator